MKKFKNIYLEITNSCNLKCSFCPSKNINGRDFMSLETFKKYFDQIKDYTEGIYLHILGEPLLNPDIFKMIDYSKDIKINLTTNGTLINRYVNELINSPINILNISLEALYPFDDEKIEEYFKNLKYLIDNNQKIKNIHLRLWNDKVKFKEFNQKIINYINEYKLLKDNVITSYGDEFVWPNGDSNVTTSSNTGGSCLGGKRQLAVHVNGEVSLCCLDYLNKCVIGNLNNMKMEEILNSKLYHQVLIGWNNRQPYFSVCQTCSYKNKFRKEDKDA